MPHNVNHPPVHDRKPDYIAAGIKLITALGLAHVALYEFARDHIVHGVITTIASIGLLHWGTKDARPSPRSA